MSRSTLLKVRRLAVKAGPILADIEGRIRELRKPFAVAHLLRLIAVFKYGKPQIVEPLANAYCRALSTFKGNEDLALREVLNTINKEPHPASSTAKSNLEEISPKISAQLRNVPAWLLWFCAAQYSTALLGIDVPPIPRIASKLKPNDLDEHAWPFLPTGRLQLRSILSPYSSVSTTTHKERLKYLELLEKSGAELTRNECRFMQEFEERDSSEADLARTERPDQTQLAAELDINIRPVTSPIILQLASGSIVQWEGQRALILAASLIELSERTRSSGGRRSQ
jgi:hypothetical protein